MRRALVTGGAGFIGSSLVDRLLSEGWHITCVDNFDPFYDRSVKRENVASALVNPNYRLVKADIRDFEQMKEMLDGRYDAIIHLAARAGVRPSIMDPLAYQEVNVCGTQNMLEFARMWETPQFIFASSSSVYGINPNVPWSEEDHVLMPISPYAGTKVNGELLGHVYSHLYGVRFIALRFFTVYGPRQRPDLAIHSFTQKIISGQPITIYGNGSTKRDYTFISDIVDGIRSAVDYTGTPYEIINLGNNHAVSLEEMIATIERVLGIKAKRNYKPIHPGDVPQTWASIEKAGRLLGYHPKTGFEDGIRQFAEWITNRPLPVPPQSRA